tara:strand:- start:149105 stop:149806 length:702 start_codon:yes stop_codon:yes gene_type:complete
MTPEDWEKPAEDLYVERMLEKICPTVLIFGGSGGIAEVIIPHLEEDYNVVALSSKDCNISNADEVKQVIEHHKSSIILSLVGMNDNAPLHKLDPSQTAEQINTMISGHLNILSCALPHMRERHFGRIIFASSVLSKKFVPGTGVYSTCKAAIERMAGQAARENGHKGVTVNTLRLGYFNAGIIKEVPELILDKIKKSIPCGELGDPEQIAQVIRTIIDCSYINGTNLEMDGGL